jgi:hypothetical protein
VSVEWWQGNMSKATDETCLCQYNSARETSIKWQKKLVFVHTMVVGKYSKRDRRNLSVPREPIIYWWGACSTMAGFEPCQLTYCQYVGGGHRFVSGILYSIDHSLICVMKLVVWSMHTDPQDQLVMEPKLRDHIQFVS